MSIYGSMIARETGCNGTVTCDSANTGATKGLCTHVIGSGPRCMVGYGDLYKSLS